MPEWSTVQVDRETLEKLRMISDALERSMAGQVRFMVNCEYEELVDRGMLSGNGQEEEISK